ncbi:MAG TPA: hypothetical protein VM733_08715 [Thermoanaerobaculia bacterium]|nr:hypothetical protein [Thermoanaerobaculia bacterium]
MAICELRPNAHLDPPVTAFTADQLRRYCLPMFESVWFGVPTLKEWHRA